MSQQSILEPQPFMDRFYHRCVRCGMVVQAQKHSWGITLQATKEVRINRTASEIYIDITLLNAYRNRNPVLVLEELKIHTVQLESFADFLLLTDNMFFAQHNLRRPYKTELKALPRNVWVLTNANSLAALLDNYDQIAEDMRCLKLFTPDKG